jgi:hypothetical protein
MRSRIASRFSPRRYELGKVHIAPLIDCGAVVRTVGREVVADVGQPFLSSIPLNQARDALAAIAVTPCAANFKKMKSAFKFTESE